MFLKLAVATEQSLSLPAPGCLRRGQISRQLEALRVWASGSVTRVLYLIDFPDVAFYIILCLSVIYCWGDNKHSRFMLRKSNAPWMSHAGAFARKEAVFTEMEDT